MMENEEPILAGPVVKDADRIEFERELRGAMEDAFWLEADRLSFDRSIRVVAARATLAMLKDPESRKDFIRQLRQAREANCSP